MISTWKFKDKVDLGANTLSLFAGDALVSQFTCYGILWPLCFVLQNMFLGPLHSSLLAFDFLQLHH